MTGKLDYGNIDREQFRAYCGAAEQLGHIRVSTLDEGNGRGMRIIDVNNGSGLSFTVVPDRNMDIVETYFQGMPVAFRTPAGYVNGARFEPEKFGWLRSWAGGMISTCGLRNVGPPGSNPDSPLEPEWGLHGRINHQAAENLATRQYWKDDKFIFSAGGTMREAGMFSENLRLEREISTVRGNNSIYLTDIVTNYGAASEILQILYHCNFGFPAISPGAEIEAVDHKLTPRDANAAAGLDCWNSFAEPEEGFAEQCFLHEIPAQENGFARIKLLNKAVNLIAELSWDTSTLPRLMQWKLQAAGAYALGFEPTNATVAGR
ncbi:MAG: aldose 1-epimerase family protein, partial [Victivallales bacterium]|nr:aldose 1-epimerase family protein [Victivallales bacterium]